MILTTKILRGQPFDSEGGAGGFCEEIDWF